MQKSREWIFKNPSLNVWTCRRSRGGFFEKYNFCSWNQYENWKNFEGIITFLHSSMLLGKGSFWEKIINFEYFKTAICIFNEWLYRSFDSPLVFLHFQKVQGVDFDNPKSKIHPWIFNLGVVFQKSSGGFWKIHP